ncbi:MAG TPA: hypothetical protein VFR47_30480 [Anaerolineales bacterium]|nr:hypothetical protein [Anaerolineales bacterium]
MEPTRRNANAVEGFGVFEIADHIAQHLKKFDKKPILIGHFMVTVARRA